MPSGKREIVPEEGRASRSAGLALTVFFLAAVSFPMLAQPFFERLGWFDKADPERGQVVRDRRLQELDLFRGLVRLDLLQTSGNPLLKHIQEFESALEERSAAAQLLRPFIQWLQLSLGNQGNEKVVASEGGWLFYRPGIDALTGRGHGSSPPAGRVNGEGDMVPLKAVLDYRDQLQSLGIELILAPVPVKAMIYPEELAPGYDPQAGPPQNSAIAQFYASLAANGVRVVDLIPEMWGVRGQVELFQPYDTHWSPQGMELFAEGLARSLIRRFPDMNGGGPVLRPRQTEVANRGDLADLLDLPSWSGYFPPRQTSIREVVNEQGRPVLPDRSSPILLLGDSSANIYSSASLKWGRGAGLAEQLSLRLGHPIDWLAVNGGGATEVRRRSADRLGGKKVVVWSFILRELGPEGRWQQVSLASEASPAPADSGMPERIEVLARVLATSEMQLEQPDVYPDTTTRTLFEVVEVSVGQYDAAEIVVAEWMMKDGEFLAPFYYYPGDEFRMVLIPLSRAEKQDPAIAQAMSADDLKRPDLPPYWLEERKP